MARPTLQRNSTLSAQDALNAMVTGIAAARTTDVFTNDVKGATLVLSVVNASKAVPAGARVIAMWADIDFRYRLNTTADLTDGAYAKAGDVIVLAIDPDDTVGIGTVQAIALGAGTLTLNWAFGT